MGAEKPRFSGRHVRIRSDKGVRLLFSCGRHPDLPRPAVVDGSDPYALPSFFPKEVRWYRIHADPEFETFTYGDIQGGRAANLTYVMPGDQLWFLARLWNHDGTLWTGDDGFYFIGFIEVERNLSFAKGTLPTDISVKVRKRIENNAHYRRIQAGDREWCRILCGKPRKSCRFSRAIRVTADVAGLLFGGSYDGIDRSLQKRKRDPQE